MSMSTERSQREFDKFEEVAGNTAVRVTGSLSTTAPTSVPAPDGRSSVALVRNVYSSTNVTTAAYVELIASTSDIINEVHIFDSSGQTLVLAFGAAASEVNKLYIFPGGNGPVSLRIPLGTRLSVKAISANATVGELTMSLMK